MDDGLLTGVTYLDLSRAFDMVSHSHLLAKLHRKEKVESDSHYMV